MEIKVSFLENLQLDAHFEDYSVITDQPIRYKGNGLAPSPFDYFLASSALCAAYFVKVYCKARNIPTDDIRVFQNNVVDPNNRYKQVFKIRVEIPEEISAKHRQGIVNAINRCTVKKVIQQGPEFEIQTMSTLGSDQNLLTGCMTDTTAKTMILGRDTPLEETIATFSENLRLLGIKIEVASWRNLVPNVWSVHIRDADSPMCFTNGKGTTKESALCSALGEYMERISCNYFYNDYFLGEDIGSEKFVHYPDEKWFPPEQGDKLSSEIMDDHMRSIYDPDGELRASHLFDTNTHWQHKGVCGIPFIRQSDGKKVFVPVNLLGNLFVSNGMSAGNDLDEAQVQALSEIIERWVKNKIITEEITLPDVPCTILAKYPKILDGIEELKAKGYPILVKDASLGGKYPVMCVALMNPKTGGLFCSFGAHPKWEVALERSLTELLQGRSFEGLNDFLPPTFSKEALSEPQNSVEHFIDSNGLVSWKFLSSENCYPFVEWNFTGSISEEKSFLLNLLRSQGKEVYIAEYEYFRAHACRIIVPGFSEIYPIDDLIWDNTNRALSYRTDILNIHSLDDGQLGALLDRLEINQIDDFTRVAEFIGIEFEEHTPWGLLLIGELKILIYLVLKNFSKALYHVKNFLTFNDSTAERKLFFRALEAVLHITIDKTLKLESFRPNLIKMFGYDTIEAVVGSVEGTIKFYGLSKTSTKLEGLHKHLKLIQSYQKIHRARSLSQV